MLALSDTAGVILLVLGVVFVVAAGVALVLRSRVTRELSLSRVLDALLLELGFERRHDPRADHHRRGPALLEQIDRFEPALDAGPPEHHDHIRVLELVRVPEKPAGKRQEDQEADDRGHREQLNDSKDERPQPCGGSHAGSTQTGRANRRDPGSRRAGL